MLLTGTTLTTSCSDDDVQAPAPVEKATLRGVVSPAGSVSMVTATAADGAQRTAMPTAGSYSLPNLAPGSYTLTFTPAADYLTPAPVAVTVASADVQAPLVTAALVPSVFAYTLDGVALTPPQGSAMVLSTRTEISFRNGDAQNVTIYLSGPLEVGKRTLTSATYRATFLGADGVTYTSQQGLSPAVTTSGVLEIKDVNLQTRRASGTYSFVAVRIGGLNGPVSRTVSNGSFSGLPF
ncbi:hypothetical protein LGH70_13220 [Hymenobacter sp. BT635]|uniref:Carboxypeptidase regulatory-like domain-containing protein n=1 Tax=Hymenobacter nitidus TaxID=2880929 RepID=A0ABS8AEI9_9BACT|nr:hypothetical protein [Hymenobacter nitidus]MCB2378554.1 hypothetical protein [Hymenobacter nitidus]